MTKKKRSSLFYATNFFLKSKRKSTFGTQCSNHSKIVENWHATFKRLPTPDLCPLLKLVTVGNPRYTSGSYSQKENCRSSSTIEGMRRLFRNSQPSKSFTGISSEETWSWLPIASHFWGSTQLGRDQLRRGIYVTTKYVDRKNGRVKTKSC